METPVLSKKQQKSSMSGKKKKETIKNVLVTPFKNYWPLLSENDAEYLHKVLNENLITLKSPRTNIPWKEIKDIPKSERRDFRNKFIKEPSENKHNRSQILCAVNEVTRGLERNAIDSILLANDVAPQIMIKHIVDMAILRKVPTLIVPNLRNISSNKTGIASVVLAFKNNVSNPKLLQITQTIHEIAEKYPIPKQHINFDRSFTNICVAQTENLSIDDNEIIEDCDEDKESIKDKESFETIKSFHLYRNNNKERVFVPPLSCKEVELELVKETDNFISFSNENEPVLLTSKSNKYKPLTVNRIRNNKNRTQEKVARLKKRNR